MCSVECHEIQTHQQSLLHRLLLLLNTSIDWKCLVMQAGGSGVLVSPLTYIFDEETPRYRNLLAALKS